MRASYKKITFLAIKQGPIQAIIIFMCLLVSSVLPVIELGTFNLIINSVMERGIRIQAIYILLYFLASVLLPNLFYFVYSYFATDLKRRLDLVLAGDALYKSTRTSATHIETGEGVNNAYRASQTQENGVAQVFFRLVELVSICPQFILLMFSLGIVGIMPAISGVLLAFVMYRVKHGISEESAQFYWAMEEDNRYADCIYNMLNNRNYAGEIRLFNTYDWIFHSYSARKKQNNLKELNYIKGAQKKGNRIEWLKIGIFAANAVVYCALVYGDVLSAGKAVTCIYATTKIYAIIAQIVEKYDQFTMQKIMIDEYNKLQDKEDEYIEDALNLESPLAISVNNLYYRYINSSHNVLNGVSFCVKAGEKVVLVGENGSGKTTLIRILLGFDVAQHGEILYNSEPVKKCLKSLRSNTTIMGQNYFQYDLPFRDNIVISDTENSSDEKKMEDVISWAGLEQIVEHLENQLDTEMIQGNQLSGGEWQRVALARMKYRERGFVVLDEPNSAVDAEYEINLYKKIFNMARGKTMIIVSHRLPICQIADKIIVMKDGEVAEVGTHSELIHRENGIYRLLFESQAKLYAT